MHDDLIERLEKATGPSRELDYAIDCFVLWGPHSDWENAGGGYERHKKTGEPRVFDLWSRARIQYTGSLDAAVELVEKMLPGWYWELGKRADVHGGASFASILRTPRETAEEPGDWTGHPTPTIALLIALLRALSNREKG